MIEIMTKTHTSTHLLKMRWWLRERPPFFLRKLLLFNLPLLLTSLKVDLETGSSEFPAANVTHQGFRSLDDLGRCKVVAALETA